MGSDDQTDIVKETKMMTEVLCHGTRHFNIPCIRRVGLARPLAWLRLGLAGMVRAWPLSLAFGVIFSSSGYWLVHAGWARPHLAMALTTGFLLIAPFLALAFHDISWRAEQKARHGVAPRPFFGVARNPASIALFGFMLAFLLSAWERLSAIVFAFHLGSAGVPEAGLAWLWSQDHAGFLVAYGVFGAAFALLVFGLSAVSLPMMLDRQVDIVTALVTSLWTVWENRAAMCLWAGLIVAMTAIGIATEFIALALIFPWLGHATWHAYRDLVLSE